MPNDTLAAIGPRYMPKLTGDEVSNCSTSSSSGVVSSGIRQCDVIITRLSVLIDEVTTEPPPGTSNEEVEERLAELQEALREARQHKEELIAQKEQEKFNRRLLVMERREKWLEELTQRRLADEAKRRQMVDRTRELMTAYAKSRNDATSEKAVQCWDHIEQENIRVALTAKQNEKRRQKNIEIVQAQREALIQRLHERDLERQARVRRVNARKAEQLEQQRAQIEAEAQEHERLIAEQTRAMREARRSKWVEKKVASRAKSKIFMRKGQIILETEAKDHDKLAEELASQVSGQQKRYAEQKARRDEELQYQANLQKMRRERQQQNMLRRIEDRLKNAQQVVESAQEKKQRGEYVKKKLIKQVVDTAIARSEDIDQHIRRSQNHRRSSENRIRTSTYQRWNSRADRALADAKKVICKRDEVQVPSNQGNSAFYAQYLANQKNASSESAQLPSQQVYRVPQYLPQINRSHV